MHKLSSNSYSLTRQLIQTFHPTMDKLLFVCFLTQIVSVVCLNLPLHWDGGDDNQEQISKRDNSADVAEEVSNEVLQYETKWFCCQLNKKENRCLKEMKEYPKNVYVPKGMKCWAGDKPPLKFTLFMSKKYK